MTPSHRRSAWTLIAVSTLALGSCAPVAVHSFVASSVQFAQYRTYEWANDGTRETGDPRLDNNPFFESRIRTETERQLAAHGFEKVIGGPPDLQLHYHAHMTQQLDVAAADQQYGYCQGCQSPSLYDAGTILLDFVDARTLTLVWRGWADVPLDGAIDDQAWLERRIGDAIAHIVATIPERRLGGTAGRRADDSAQSEDSLESAARR